MTIFLRKELTKILKFCQIVNYNFVCTWLFPDPTIHIPFPSDLFLYVNLVTKGAPKSFKTLHPCSQVLDITYFADTNSHTVHPLDSDNF